MLLSSDKLLNDFLGVFRPIPVVALVGGGPVVVVVGGDLIAGSDSDGCVCVTCFALAFVGVCGAAVSSMLRDVGRRTGERIGERIGEAIGFCWTGDGHTLGADVGVGELS